MIMACKSLCVYYSKVQSVMYRVRSCIWAIVNSNLLGQDWTPGLCTAGDSQGDVLWYPMSPCRVWDSLWRDRVGLKEYTDSEWFMFI